MQSAFSIFQLWWLNFISKHFTVVIEIECLERPMPVHLCVIWEAVTTNVIQDIQISLVGPLTIILAPWSQIFGQNIFFLYLQRLWWSFIGVHVCVIPSDFFSCVDNFNIDVMKAYIVHLVGEVCHMNDINDILATSNFYIVNKWKIAIHPYSPLQRKSLVLSLTWNTPAKSSFNNSYVFSLPTAVTVHWICITVQDI